MGGRRRWRLPLGETPTVPDKGVHGSSEGWRAIGRGGVCTKPNMICKTIIETIAQLVCDKEIARGVRRGLSGLTRCNL